MAHPASPERQGDQTRQQRQWESHSDPEVSEARLNEGVGAVFSWSLGEGAAQQTRINDPYGRETLVGARTDALRNAGKSETLFGDLTDDFNHLARSEPRRALEIANGAIDRFYNEVTHPLHRGQVTEELMVINTAQRNGLTNLWDLQRQVVDSEIQRALVQQQTGSLGEAQQILQQQLNHYESRRKDHEKAKNLAVTPEARLRKTLSELQRYQTPEGRAEQAAQYQERLTNETSLSDDEREQLQWRIDAIEAMNNGEPTPLTPERRKHMPNEEEQLVEEYGISYASAAMEVINADENEKHAAGNLKRAQKAVKVAEEHLNESNKVKTRLELRKEYQDLLSKLGGQNRRDRSAEDKERLAELKKILPRAERTLPTDADVAAADARIGANEATLDRREEALERAMREAEAPAERLQNAEVAFDNLYERLRQGLPNYGLVLTLQRADELLENSARGELESPALSKMRQKLRERLKECAEREVASVEDLRDNFPIWFTDENVRGAVTLSPALFIMKDTLNEAPDYERNQSIVDSEGLLLALKKFEAHNSQEPDLFNTRSIALSQGVAMLDEIINNPSDYGLSQRDLERFEERRKKYMSTALSTLSQRAALLQGRPQEDQQYIRNYLYDTTPILRQDGTYMRRDIIQATEAADTAYLKYVQLLANQTGDGESFEAAIRAQESIGVLMRSSLSALRKRMNRKTSRFGRS